MLRPALRPSSTPRRLPALLVATLALPALGQALVRDINPSSVNASGSSSPGEGASVGGFTVFAGTDTTHGREVWRTDGTAAGTYLLKDIRPGLSSSQPSLFTAFTSTSPFVVFVADDGRNGEELWITDGTPAGTRLLADIRPGPAGSSPRTPNLGMTLGVVDTLFFSADDGTHGREPFVLDLSPTPGTPTLIADVRPGALGSMTATAPLWDANAFAPSAYAALDNGVIGEEPWLLTPSSATLLADLNPGASGSNPRPISTRLITLIAATHASSGREPWVRTPTGFALAADINPGAASSDPSETSPELNPLSPTFVFAATTAATGRELHKLTTVTSTTFTHALVRDIEPGTASSNPELLDSLSSVTNNPVRLLFAATTAASGRELWRSDATAAGTVMVADLAAGAASSNPALLTTYRFTSSIGHLLLALDDGVGGREPWHSDSTASGTFALPVAAGAAGSSPNLVARLGDTTLFAANDQVHGTELFVTDVNSTPPTLVRDLNAPKTHSRPAELIELPGTGTALFVANDGVAGVELWRSDTTTAGTSMLVDIAPGALGANPSELTLLGNQVVFAADDGAAGRELWISDGTAAGTRLLRDIAPGAPDSDPGELFAFGNYVYFAAAATSNDRELWRTDGTTAGTTLVKDIFAGASGSYPRGFVALGANLYFTARDGLGAELWRTDGSTAGTTLVKDIFAGANSSVPGTNPLATPHAPVVVGSVMYFAAQESLSTGIELFRSDGTAAGTVLVDDIEAGSGSSSPGEFAALPGRVVFAATTAASGRELWTSTGTAASTLLLADAAAGATSGNPSGCTVLGAYVIYAANRQGSAGFELWRTQGTPATTTLLADLHPGLSDGVLPPPAGGSVWFAAIAGSDRAWFAAMDASTGVELWRTDGTALGTVRVTDVAPGAFGSFPSKPVRVGSSLLFAADDGSGIELWSIAAPASFATFGLGCRGSSGIPWLTASEPPRIGASTFRLLLSDALPSTAAAVILGVPARALNLGGGCAAYFDVLGPQVSLSTTVNLRGDAAIPLALPLDRGLVGARLGAQGLVADPAGAFARLLAFTAGLELVIGS